MVFHGFSCVQLQVISLNAALKALSSAELWHRCMELSAAEISDAVSGWDRGQQGDVC